ASTQNQALLALLFLYQQVLGIELLWLEDVTRAKRPVRLPLSARFMYGSGLCLMETLRLRSVVFPPAPAPSATQTPSARTRGPPRLRGMRSSGRGDRPFARA